MSWIYSIFVWFFMAIVIFTNGEIQMLFLGLEIGVLIGQIIYFIDFMRRNR